MSALWMLVSKLKRDFHVFTRKKWFKRRFRSLSQLSIKKLMGMECLDTFYFKCARGLSVLLNQPKRAISKDIIMLTLFTF